MSTAVRAGVSALFVLVLVVGAIAGWGLLQRQNLLQQNQGLNHKIFDTQNQLAEQEKNVKQLQDQAAQLNSQITQAQQDKAQIQSQFEELKQKSSDIQNQLTQTSSDRDEWKSRVDTITHERDSLMEKLKNQPVKIIYKDRVVQAPSDQEAALGGASGSTSQNDQYWASVLRQKADLQLKLSKEQIELNDEALQLVDLKKQNADLQTQVQQITNEKDEIVQKIKYGQDLADNLSIDLARSRNDQQAVNDRADKLKEQNMQLLDQIRELDGTKLELERTVSRLTDQKDSLQRKLVETQSVIQSRIDDIWKIKQGLDQRLSENSPNTSNGGSGMELPPIIVNAPNTANANVNPVAQAVAPAGAKTQGSIISINESNNFVISDLGQQNSTVSVGTTLRVYRGDDVIGNLEVIQVRRDICAADIKDSTTKLRVGDVVRFN